MDFSLLAQQIPSRVNLVRSLLVRVIVGFHEFQLISLECRHWTSTSAVQGLVL